MAGGSLAAAVCADVDDVFVAIDEDVEDDDAVVLDGGSLDGAVEAAVVEVVADVDAVDETVAAAELLDAVEEAAVPDEEDEPPPP